MGAAHSGRLDQLQKDGQALFQGYTTIIEIGIEIQSVSISITISMTSNLLWNYQILPVPHPKPAVF